MASQPTGGQTQLKAEEQAPGNQNTNFLNETGGEVNKMAHGAADIASGATQGAIHLVQGVASGAANLTKGAADAVNNTFGTNPKNPR